MTLAEYGNQVIYLWGQQSKKIYIQLRHRLVEFVILQKVTHGDYHKVDSKSI